MVASAVEETEYDWRREAYEFASAKMDHLGSQFPSLLLFPRSVNALARASGLKVLRRSIPEFTGRAALVGRYIILGSGLGSREAKFAGFHEMNHHWLGTTHSLDEVSGARGGARSEEIMADAGAGAVVAPHDELRRVLATALGERASSSLRPYSPARWAAQELRSGAISAAVHRFDVNYEVVVRALANAGLVEGAEPWAEHTVVWVEYLAAWKPVGLSRPH